MKKTSYNIYLANIQYLTKNINRSLIKKPFYYNKYINYEILNVFSLIFNCKIDKIKSLRTKNKFDRVNN